MIQEATLRCRCGNVEGRVTNASRETVNRVVCYCDDCQAFLHHLGRADLLDGHGGSDIVQVAPASLSFGSGTEHIAGVRLTPKGLYRYYTTCCKTPIGNTAAPAIPFVGIIAHAFEEADRVFGAPIGGFQGRFGVGAVPESAVKANPRLLLRAIRTVLGWRLRGQAWPHPFFDRAAKSPLHPLTVLSREEREALRALCGPRPSA